MRTRSPTTAAILSLALLSSFPANALVTITQHPADQVVSLNGTVTLQVTASSTAPPITYQWYGKGVLLPDQTTRTLVLHSIQLDQAGEYHVVVNDAGNQPVQSNPATLTVDPTFVKITEDDIVKDREPSYSSTWLDYDNDGDPDLWVSSRDGHCRLHQNDGRGYFSAATNSGSIATVPANGTAVWGDYDNDGWLDLFTVAYV